MAATRQKELAFGPVINSGLFSAHWLKERLRLEPEWDEWRDESKAVLSRLVELWKTERSRVEKYESEASLEYRFIQPVFEHLGWTPDYQTKLQNRAPDYALFISGEEFDHALAVGKSHPEYWGFPSALADAKAWRVPLDRPIRSSSQREFPPQQMEWYLNRSAVPFGILTNGEQWRLIPRDRQPYQGRFDTFLEVRLCEILDRWLAAKTDLIEREQLEDDFLQFYLFFSPRGFATDVARKSLIVRAVEGSSEYRLGVGEDLRNRAFNAVQLCIQGLLDFKPNGLNAEEHLEECRQQSFTLIYRLLFVLFAEDRGLLPYGKNPLYTNNRSLRRFRDDIHRELEPGSRAPTLGYKKDTTQLWSALRDLFDLVDRGHARYEVPAYNGGLFDPEEHPFWELKQVPDWYLARIIHKLGHAADPSLPKAGLFRVDYRDLAIQHLGGIYESLLELEPKIATVPMVVIRKDSRDGVEEKIVAQSSPMLSGFHKTDEKYGRGMVFLQTNKGERRASGSYYTPDHIVNHIVEQTLGSLCERINGNLEREIAEANAAFDRSHSDEDRQRLELLKADYDDRVLRLRVLDPAMGSGHFLLRACSYLAEEIATHQYARVESLSDVAGESAVVFWKRKVAENCLFGVDLNGLAVELAKLALWLETVAVDQPLTFLNHHLRTGNSLIGPRVDDLRRLPGAGELLEKTFANTVRKSLPNLLTPLAEIRRTDSRTVGDVKQKQRSFQQFERQQQVFRRMADVWCAGFIPDRDVPLAVGDFQRALEALDKPTSFNKIADEPWFQAAEQAARRPELRGFAWELEFPDVFFDDHGRSERPGFDAIIGNPPYDVLAEAESGRDLSAIRAYINFEPVYRPSQRGKNNLYKLFVCRSLQLLAEGGDLGFITPMPILGDDQAADLRRAMLDAGRLVSIDAFPQKDNPRRRVFREAKLSTAVFVLRKTAEPAAREARFTSRVHPGRELTEVQAELQLSSAEIPLYDPANLTIVSCSQADWDLATRIMGSGRMTRLGQFAEFFQGEVNETNERAKGNISYDEADGQMVVRGAAICLYVVRPASQGRDFYVLTERFLRDRSPDSKAFHHQHARVGVQESSPQNNFRRIIATLIPVGEFCNHTINYCPAHRSQIDLRQLLGILNSKLAEWYFRLGSTNAHVSHYQLSNLPFPKFAATSRAAVRQRDAVLRKLSAGQVDDAFELLCPLLADAPFDPLLRDALITAVDRITDLEHRRGEISRTARSALAPAAQPFQDFIDRILFQMAGLTPDEIFGLEQRLAEML